MFADCFDEDMLSTRIEKFYKNMLAKRCNTTTFDEVQSILNYTLSTDLSDSDSVDICDYFEFGSGYQFSVVD